MSVFAILTWAQQEESCSSLENLLFFPDSVATGTKGVRRRSCCIEKIFNFFKVKDTPSTFYFSGYKVNFYQTFLVSDVRTLLILRDHCKSRPCCDLGREGKSERQELNPALPVSSLQSWVNCLLSLTFYFFICKMRIIILTTLSVHVNCLTQYLTDSKHLINGNSCCCYSH